MDQRERRFKLFIELWGHRRLLSATEIDIEKLAWGNQADIANDVQPQKGRIMIRQILAASVCFLLCVEATLCHADLLNPTGLGPGDTYHIAFVTEGRRDATSFLISGYNDFVTAEANRAGSLVAGLSPTWKAIASTSGVNAKTNTGTDDSPAGPNGSPIYLVDGATRIADDYDDLWDGEIAAPLFVDQFGGTHTSSDLWTGTGGAGTASAPLGSAGPLWGAGTTTSSPISPVTYWVSAFAYLDNTTDLRMYAISEELTVAAIPEPSSFLLVGMVGLSGLLLNGRRRRHRKVPGV